MHNDEKFQKIIGDNFKDDADKYIDKVTKKNLLVEEREIHGQQDQSNMGARINKYDLLINRRKEEVRKISDSINVLERKSGILDEDGNPTEESRRAQKELIEQQKDLNQHKGKLSKLEINKNKKLTSSKELDKKIEKEKKDMKRNIEELEKEIKSMDGTIHSMVEKAKNILSEDVKEINQKAQEDLNDYQEKRSKNREILHEHMKEAKKAAAQGEYYSSGRGKHNT